MNEFFKTPAGQIGTIIIVTSIALVLAPAAALPYVGGVVGAVLFGYGFGWLYKNL